MELTEQIKAASKAFIIAEVGVNYYDIAECRSITPMEAACLMIDEAVDAGVDAVKFQTYKAEKIVSVHSPAYWDTTEEPTQSQFELFKKFDHFGEAEYRQLAAHCEKRNTIFLSTPFDFEAADYLNELMPLYKISSSDLTNLPFITHMAQKGKPIFLSTGAATVSEIDAAVQTVLDTGNNDICLMHCVLDYPTDYKDANLNMLQHLAQIYPGMLLGFSDHTRPDPTMMAMSAAYMLGAKVIEKHFTLDKSLKGNDHYHGMDPVDLARLVANIKMIETVKGQFIKAPLPCEMSARKQARRSLVTRHALSNGDTITSDNISFKRPGTGISPADFHKVNGLKIRKDVAADHIITWEDLA
ncbi:MAG: N-acetylneuraminate synthase family protein [Deltaproteobacteria bacterium]|nr:N-acetylneuraminate synthase family protein [Deltaproteobacteria bacterium]MBN2672601.1 N-acetylneuraminate synthase family protein [Deltaproteobacteria bacterium]